jgi:hypothetical protein
MSGFLAAGHRDAEAFGRASDLPLGTTSTNLLVCVN